LVFAGFCLSFLLIFLVISFSFYVLMTYPESWVKSSFHCWEADEASRVTTVQQDSIHTHKPPAFMLWVVEFLCFFCWKSCVMVNNFLIMAIKVLLYNFSSFEGASL
jgi:hypothetical protein